MQYEFWIRGEVSKIFGGPHIRYIDDRSWGIDEYHALENFLDTELKNQHKKQVSAIVRILPTGRKRNEKKERLSSFIPVPLEYTPFLKSLITYYWIRIHRAETIDEVDELKVKFEERSSVRDLTEEHQLLFRTLMTERSKAILSGKIKPYIYSLLYEVPDEWASDKKFTHYVSKSIKNLKLAGYRIKKPGIKFEVTASEWIQQTFNEPRSQMLLPIEIILYWQHIAHFYKKVNDFVEVLPKSHNKSVISCIGMQIRNKIDSHLMQLKKEQIPYWLLNQDGMECIYVIHDDYIKAKKLLSTIKPSLIQSIDDYIDYSDDNNNIDERGHLTEVFWESYD